MIEEYFTDMQGRSIRIILDDGSGNIFAFEGNNKIGEIEILQIENERDFEYHIWSADVSDGFQRAGIGGRMIQMAFDTYGLLHMPNPNPMESENRLTTAGLSLCMSGVRKGFIRRFEG